MPEQPQITAQAALYGPRDERPDWAEGYLQVEVGGQPVVALDITRNGGEAIAEALHGVLHPGADRNVRRAVQVELDAVVERLLTGVASDDDKGRAQGLTYALAVITNPAAPDVPGTKAAALARVRPAAAEVVTDEQTLWLRDKDVLSLWTLADEVRIRNYKKMSKADLLSALDQFDLDKWRLPAPVEEDDDEVLFAGE